METTNDNRLILLQKMYIKFLCIKALTFLHVQENAPGT